MAEEEVNWNARLAVKFIPLNGEPEIISPIENFEPSVELPADVIDSIESDNLGYSSQNTRFTFTFDVMGVNKNIIRRLFATSLKQRRFSLGIALNDGESDDWFLDTIEFSECRVVNVDPSNIDNEGGVPSLSFEAKALSISASDSGNTIVSGNGTGATGDL